MSEKKEKKHRGATYVWTKADKDLVRKMARIGRSNAVIANRLGIDKKTVAIHFKDILKHEREDTLSTVEDGAYTEALKGNPRMMELVLKTQCGWSETRKIKVELPTVMLKVLVSEGFDEDVGSGYDDDDE